MSVPTNWIVAAALSAVALVFAAVPAAAQSNTCEYAYDGECDESFGTGICAEGTDTWDCRRTGPPPGPESCPYSRDGECDEPGGTMVCIPFTDTADCRREGIDPNRVFFGSDDRFYPDVTVMPWRAIGQITYVSGGHCSGALVGPDLVLTAAHCMFGGEGPGGRDEPLQFLAGLSGPNAVDFANVVGIYMPPEYDDRLHSETSDIDGYDWAILTLDQRIGDRLGWLDVEPLSAGELNKWVSQRTPIMQGGYSYDSKSFLSANQGCHLLDVWSDNTVFHQCDTLVGDSGSPLFIAVDGGYRVIGLESATYPNDQSQFDDNMAVDARAFWQAVQQFAQ